jgi:hypothetical protein
VSASLSTARNAPAELRRWPRLIVLSAALAALLVVATGAALWHQDSPGTPCSICYAAHLPAMSNLPVRTPVASDAVAWLVPAEFRVNQATPERLNAPPRAPPA